MESYSVEAVLSAVDKNFTSTMNKADSSMGALDKRSQNTNTSILDIAKGVGVFKLVDSAVGLVRNSLDGAIDRFDTLNKYPVVMQALGYSASDVDKSMAKLNKGIDGLPTSLDEIVSNTQQLAISTGSLTKGTDTAIALNNAFLASGASTADASRGMQQYVQMLSKGTVDMQSWRSLQETMPVAMDKVAKSFKDQGVNSVSDLYDALQSGKITFDDFNNRLIKLNGGVGGFAELAKKNSAGIKTSFKNVKTAVVKGLANVLSAIDNGMKSAGLGSIAQNFDKLKIVVNQVFNAITKAIPPVISVIARIIATFKTLFDFVNQNKDWIGPLVAGITAGVAAYKLWKGAITAWNTATKIATAVQVAFNAVMDANPIMLIVIAIAAIVAGLVYFFTQTKTGQKIWSNFVKFLGSAWQSLVDTAKSVWSSITGAFNDSVKGIQDGWNSITSFFSNLWQGIVNTAVGIWNGFTSTLSGIWQGTVIAAHSVWSAITGFFSGLWNGIVSTAQNIWNGLVSFMTNLWNGMVSTAVNIWNGLLNGIVSIANSIKDGAINAWNSLVSGVKNLINSLVNGAISTWNNLKSSVISIANGIKDGAINAWNALVSGVQSIINSVVNIFGTIKNINLLDIGKAIIDGFVKGLKSAWKAGMKFIGGIGDWIKKHKGPIRIDRKLLIPAGNAIMNGLNSGLTGGFRDVQSNVSGMGDMIANAINSDYSVDIGANVAAANRSISSQVSHDVNLNQGKQPASFTVKLGNQVFKAFVDDISNAQGQAINLNMGF
ncbi:tape measure protein [Lactococcus lactis]|uniref:tape measure protein n=1 Tax=Lactococcus lactis TaxID=1358 RepID=UPI0024A76D17|nr:tape measure protein [Lactococcus lactis]